MRLGATPTMLGLGFFFCCSVTLSVWAQIAEPQSVPETYLTYSKNVSWPFSILFIFPFIVALTPVFYHRASLAITSVLDLVHPEADCRTELNQYIFDLKHRFNQPHTSFITASVAVLYGALVVNQTLNQGFVGWMSSDTYFSFLSSNGHGLTGVGVAAILLQTVLVYWVLNIFWRGLLLSGSLKELFEIAGDDIGYRPDHVDRCCGLRPIGDAAMTLNVILFFLGTYLSLKLFDKTIIQGVPLSSDVGGLLLLGGFLVIAPLLFQSTISAARKFMIRAKKEFLKPIDAQLRIQILAVGKGEPVKASVYKDMLAIDQTSRLLRRKISIWPFSFRYIPGLSFVAPMLSVIVSIILVSAKSLAPIFRIVSVFN